MDEMLAGDDIAVLLHLASPISSRWARVDEPTGGRETRERPRFALWPRKALVLWADSDSDPGERRAEDTGECEEMVEPKDFVGLMVGQRAFSACGLPATRFRQPLSYARPRADEDRILRSSGIITETCTAKP
ncbi:hypothetical protein M404DRAFT_28087 [Pisolithus tinctorius Marx 270]|uniref:Uncharacterized protein n=1 Tax=Pisolithus tinctorius Marx 270 TaxID=870435 RepID=A0A0C3NML8_PISTI|nr:hypothetical protein M404DRAFT_28087 [Pisolithus tinctorius Marx 270]